MRFNCISDKHWKSNLAWKWVGWENLWGKRCNAIPLRLINGRCRFRGMRLKYMESARVHIMTPDSRIMQRFCIHSLHLCAKSRHRYLSVLWLKIFFELFGFHGFFPCLIEWFWLKRFVGKSLVFSIFFFLRLCMFKLLFYGWLRWFVSYW